MQSCAKNSWNAAKCEISHFSSNKNVKFWQHFWAENILKVQTKGKDIPADNNMTPWKLSILCENTYEIWIKIVKGKKGKKKKKGKKWNVG